LAKGVFIEKDELNQLIKAAREAAFFIRSIDGYENSKIANDLSTLAEKVESQKLLAIGRLAARVVMRNSRKAVEQCVHPTPPTARSISVTCPKCGTFIGVDFAKSAGG